MRRGLMIVLAMTLLCGIAASPTLAGPGCDGASKTKATACGKTCGAGGFPTMAFMVGDKTYDSHEAAEKAAGDRGDKIVFVVCDERFGTMPDAMKALACASECYAEKFTSIGGIVDGKLVYCSASQTCGNTKDASCSSKTKGASCHSQGAKAGAKTCSGKKNCSCEGCTKSSAKGSCSKTGAKSAKKGSCAKGTCPRDKATKFVVAGMNFDKYDDAVTARDEARKAASAVKLSYLVNGQKVDCESKVCPKAKAAGQVKFIVSGDETNCEIQARVLVAKAQVAAAAEALKSKNAATARL